MEILAFFGVLSLIMNLIVHSMGKKLETMNNKERYNKQEEEVFIVRRSK